MQSFPDARFLPVPQASPAGRSAAATQFLGQQTPRAASSQDEDNAGEDGAISDTRATALRLRRLLREQRLDSFPEVVGDKRFAHSKE